MSRKNHPRHSRRPNGSETTQKPRGLKRPRRFHNGRSQDREWERARRRLDEAA